MTDDTVVASMQPLTKARLHAKVMRGWVRGIDRHGKGAWADRIDCSVQALDKQLAGSLPTLETIDRAIDAELTVMDDYFAAKGKRLVDAEAVCDVDDMSLLIARVLVMIQEAEHPGGPGGRSVTHTEYLDGEKLMRELHGASSRWLERCSHIRTPREVAA